MGNGIIKAMKEFNVDGANVKEMPVHEIDFSDPRIESMDFSDMDAFRGKLDNSTVRKWYRYHDERIHELIDDSMPIEEAARRAFELRNLYRTQARELMADQEQRKALDRTDPNWEWEDLIASKMKRKGLSRIQAIRDIYETALKTNRKVNTMLGLE